MKKTIELLVILVLLAVFIFLGRTKLAILYYRRGNSLYEGGSYREAVANFNRSLKINPTIAVVHYALAGAYLAAGLEDQAIAEYKKTIQYDPASIWSYKALAHIYLECESYSEALAVLSKAEAAIPHNPEVKKLWNRASFEYMAYCLDGGVNAFSRGDKARAYELLKKALEIRSDFAFVHYTLGYLYYTEQKYDAARISLNKAINLDSKFWPAHKLLGNIYFEEGAYEKALAEYKTALGLDASDSSLYNDLGLALMNLERYREAIPYLEGALRLNPGNINIRYSLASVYRDNARFAEAISEYKKVTQYQPDYPNIHNDLGDIYQQQGKASDAEAEYRKEIKYAQARLRQNPDDAAVMNGLAYAYAGAKEYNKAGEIIGKVLAGHPGYQQAYLTYAKICEGLGQTDKALAALEKARALSKKAHFIDRDIARVKKDLAVFLEGGRQDTVYLKNGRTLKGRIRLETEDRVILEMNMGGSAGTVTLYRDAIERIAGDEDDG